MSKGWIPGVDFDPHDPEEMEVMKVVWAQEKADSIEALRRENDLLRQALAKYETEDENE